MTSKAMPHTNPVSNSASIQVIGCSPVGQTRRLTVNLIGEVLEQVVPAFVLGALGDEKPEPALWGRAPAG